MIVAAAAVSGDALQQQPAPASPAQGGPSAATTDPDAQQPVFRAGVNFVRVDVIVTDRSGNPINDLKPEDFEVTEEGRPQKVETFKLIALDGGLIPGPNGPPRQIRTDTDEEDEAARDDVRLFAIFLDDYHVRRETSMAAREPIARFVETQLGPSDMVGVMYPLQPTATVRMTRNHAAVVTGLRQFVGRKYDYTPQNAIEERYVYNYPTEVVERIRNQVSMTAIRALIMRLGALKEGRKALILVSEGYSNILPPQMRDAIAGQSGLGNPARDDPNAGLNSPIEDRAAFAASMDMEEELREIYDTANRYNTAIYTVDPRGLAPYEFGIDQNVGIQIDRGYLYATLDTLRTLAAETDGRAIVSRNDLTIGMKQIVRDTSAYYLLGYNSTNARTDGRFHEIKVRVRRPGVRVRARKGYWAYTAADAARATAPPKPEPPRAIESALAAITQSSRGARVVRTWIGTERGTNGRTKVTFVWEPLPRVPGQSSRQSEQPARVSLTAAGPDGSPYFRGRVPSQAAMVPTGPTRISFEAQPGKLELRMSVEGTSAEVLDTEVREILVPDLSSTRTALGTPEVFRARTVRELQQLKADPAAAPVAAREFSRADRLLLRVPAYGPADGAPKLTATLLNRAGQSIRDLPVAASALPAVSEIDLMLASLPPGEYLVEITASGEGGDDVKELVGFRITG
jgi:VWFA-related protein